MADELDAALRAIDGWGGPRAAAKILVGHRETDIETRTHGPADVILPWASVTKLVTAWSALVAVDRGLLRLDDPVGPAGASVGHLLAHASGLGFDSQRPLSPPARTRMYSNAGYDLLGSTLAERAGRPFEGWLTASLLEPLGMSTTRLAGRPSQGLIGPLEDLAAFGRELLRPTLIAPGLAAKAVSPAFAGLAGILPGVGRYEDLAWGLGPEVHAGKTQHWMGRANSSAAFGHFGRSGSFLWVDPRVDAALVCLSDREFGPWALAAWPAMSDAVVAAVSLARAADAAHRREPPTRRSEPH